MILSASFLMGSLAVMRRDAIPPPSGVRHRYVRFPLVLSVDPASRTSKPKTSPVSRPSVTCAMPRILQSACRCIGVAGGTLARLEEPTSQVGWCVVMRSGVAACLIASSECVRFCDAPHDDASLSVFLAGEFDGRFDSSMAWPK